VADSAGRAADPIHAFFAELGIIDPVAIATARQEHAELIEAHRHGKITDSDLKHSLASGSGADDSDDDLKPVP
jgi:hypothetical protein